MERFRFFKIVSTALAFCFVGVNSVFAQHSIYDQHQAFDPTFLNQPGTVYRDGSGKPGPQYWQNRPDYQISVTLDPKDHTLSGTDEIHYTNNSPDDLNYLWLQLDQNLYKQSSRGYVTAKMPNPRYITPDFNGGYKIQSVEVELNGRKYKPKYIVTDTRMQVLLNKPVGSKGGEVTLRINYSYPIPPFRQRTGYYETKNGPIYAIAEWYPRMCVYDDIIGWNTLPYLGRGQFYLDYGTTDYKITVPWNYLVIGSGELENPKDVLTSTQIQRLNKAHHSDKTVMIRSAEEVGSKESRPVHKGSLTWYFAMKNTRDVAWAASPAFVWDAARINLPDHKTSLAESVYPVESDKPDAWGSSTQFVKGTIEYDSKHWFPYPYPTAVNVAAKQGGMEYPGMVFCGYRDSGEGLWGVTTHEMGHTWFPMIVGSDEREYGFMDEGFNSFIDIYSTRGYDNGKFVPYSRIETSMPLAARYLKASGQPDAIITYADVIQRNYVGMNNYAKPAIGLYLLREYVLGHKRFDFAFRTYIRRWAYKHPTPKDFFRTINDASGENLNYFWKGWFYKTWMIDQAVEKVAYVHDDPAQGSLITIANLDKLPMPVKVKVYQVNGKSGSVRLPVEMWQRGGKWQFEYNSTSRLDSVVIDPDYQLPDVDRSNNKWVRRDLRQ